MLLRIHICVALLLLAMPIVADAAERINLDVSLAKGTLSADTKQLAYLKVGLTGFELPSKEDRAPVNVAIVLDKSGSMNGKKIEQAKKAAVAAIDRLNENDIVSIVAYAAHVEVIVPATKLTDKPAIRDAISQINAGGSTALFAGVSNGAAEVRKFLDQKYVNRVILLSDGKANVGPNSPSELGDLGESLLKESISVSTMGLGLGYNEDLMSQLAEASNGNHMFIEQADELIAIFNEEFNDVLSVVAQEVSLNITLADNVRPVRALGREAEIVGQQATVNINQIYAGQEKYALLEVEMPPKPDGSKMHVASVSVSYANMHTNENDELSGSVDVSFSNDEELVDASLNKKVMTICVLQVANENNRRATWLRDKGRVQEAKQVLFSNSAYIGENNRFLGSDLLELRCQDNYIQAEQIDVDWTKVKKIMRQKQNEDVQQQRIIRRR
ncbi:MAG: VWA domain-containing protein [Planctomycetales bacterium]|nr:VWA domain-containing protein [Planctomycetales bacterium]